MGDGVATNGVAPRWANLGGLCSVVSGFTEGFAKQGCRDRSDAYLTLNFDGKGGLFNGRRSSGLGAVVGPGGAGSLAGVAGDRRRRLSRLTNSQRARAKRRLCLEFASSVERDAFARGFRLLLAEARAESGDTLPVGSVRCSGDTALSFFAVNSEAGGSCVDSEGNFQRPEATNDSADGQEPETELEPTPVPAQATFPARSPPPAPLSTKRKSSAKRWSWGRNGKHKSGRISNGKNRRLSKFQSSSICLRDRSSSAPVAGLASTAWAGEGSQDSSASEDEDEGIFVL